MTITAISPVVLPAPGRWTVTPAGSRLLMDTTVRGVIAVRGRFTDVAGHVDVASDLGESRMWINVTAASLTTGFARLDRMLTTAGLIDPDAGPVVRFRSQRVQEGPAGLLVDGTLATDRASRPLRLEVALPRTADSAGLCVRARGRIGRDVIGALLARPGTERLLGATAELDLTVALRAPTP